MLENQHSRYGAITRMLPPTLGKVFFVIHTDNANLLHLLEEFPVDRDGVPRTYATVSGAATDNLAIQAALDACVAGRNDYVIIMPGNGNDYDCNAQLTMSKNDVHLVSLEGLDKDPNRVGASRQVVLEQTGAYDLLNISGQNCEFAGFYIKNKANYSVVQTANAAHSANIHHNLSYIVTSTTMSVPVFDIGANTPSAIYCKITNNFFTSVAGTCLSAIGVGSGCTGTMVERNYIIVGDGATVTTGISNAAYKGVTQFNTVAAITGAGADGTVTTCFYTAGGVCNHNVANAANSADYTIDGTNNSSGNYTNTDHIT